MANRVGGILFKLVHWLKVPSNDVTSVLSAKRFAGIHLQRSTQSDGCGKIRHSLTSAEKVFGYLPEQSALYKSPHERNGFRAILE